MSTDTSIEPQDIIEPCAKRFNIECMFKSMKYVACAFSNRFRTIYPPKLSRFAKSGDADRVKQVKLPHEKEGVRMSLDA